ncbi:hypothetical protein [Rheinheimera sp.]|uniref:hypothetical protein n=1 Tax=Rheinheimera sp. TaxID=1869214 RepID=UPI003AF574E2
MSSHNAQSNRHRELDNKKCTDALNWLLEGAWLCRFEFCRTGWELWFSLDEGYPSVSAGLIDFPFELVLQASVAGSGELESEAEVAGNLVRATRHKISEVTVDAESNLCLMFGKEAQVRFAGKNDPVDEVWSLYRPQSASHKRGFGEPCLMQSYFGELFMAQEFDAAISATVNTARDES